MEKPQAIIQLERSEATPAESGSIALMRLIERAAEKSDFDVNKLEKLLEVKERWEKNEARKAFVAAVAEFKCDPPKITKNRQARFTSKRTGEDTDYNYATLDNIVDAIGPALSRHGLSHRWKTEQLDGGIIRVTCVLTHIMGHSEETSLQAGPDQSGSKNNIQAVASTVSYLEKYTLLSGTGMATSEMDDDGRGIEFITVEQAYELENSVKAMAESLGYDFGKVKDRFLQAAGVDSFVSIQADRFEDAKRILQQKKATK